MEYMPPARKPRDLHIATILSVLMTVGQLLYGYQAQAQPLDTYDGRQTLRRQQELNSFQIQQQRTNDALRSAQERIRQRQQRILQDDESRREHLRHQLESAQDSIRERQDQNLERLRQQRESIRDQNRIDRLNAADDITRERTMESSQIREQQRQQLENERRRQSLQTRSARQAGANRFLRDRYFDSQLQRGR
jgi:hypothetical protein